MQKRERGELAHQRSRSRAGCSKMCLLRAHPISGLCVRSLWARGVGQRPEASRTRLKTVIGTRTTECAGRCFRRG